jgi:hypothetical protein
MRIQPLLVVAGVVVAGAALAARQDGHDVPYRA